MRPELFDDTADEDTLFDPVPPEPTESPTLTAMRERLVHGLDLLNLPPLEWLVAELVPRPALVALYGPPKAGKSFVAIDLALTVAVGRKWLGRATEPGLVLYVMAEGQAGASLRLDAWVAYHGITSEQPPNIKWYPAPINLYETDASQAVADIARELGARLVIFDTLARCSVGADEISAKDMGVLVHNADKVKHAANCTVMIVHHSGKDTSRGMRGSNAFFGAVDAVLKVSGSGGRVRLEVEDAKDFASGFTVNFGTERVHQSLVLVEGGTGDIEAFGGKAEEALLALHECAPPEGLAATAWRQLCEMSDRTFYRARKHLIDSGKVTNVGTSRVPRYLAVGNP